MAHRSLAIVCLLVLGSSIPAFAGDPPPGPVTGTEPRVGDLSLSVAGGAAVHYLFEYPDPSFAWMTGVRLGLHRHVAVEAEVGRRTYRSVVIPSPGGPEQANPLLETEWHESTWNVDANLVLRTAGRTVSVWGGGGIGLYRVTGESSWRFHDGSVESFSAVNNQAGVQFVGGLDAAVSRRWRAFAAMRVDVPYPQDFGSAVPTVMGGIRMVF